MENRPLVKFMPNYIQDPSGVFSISSLVRISMTSFSLLHCCCAKILLSIIIKRKLHGGLKILRRFPLNVQAVSAKIKLPKKYLQHCHIWRTFAPKLTPREKIGFLKLSIFQLKRRFMSVQNKMAPVFSILL